MISAAGDSIRQACKVMLGDDASRKAWSYDELMKSINPWSQLQKVSVLLATMVFLTSCSSLINNATTQLANNLSTAILGSSDVDTVREAIPAYLVLIDSLVLGDKPSPDLLLAAADLNGAFASLVDARRSAGLSAKALNYAKDGACLKSTKLCGLSEMSFEDFSGRVAEIQGEDLDPAFALAAAWTGWILANRSDWEAVGQLARVKALMSRILALKDDYDAGRAHLYMGGLETVLPASMGGNPDKGRLHFEKAGDYSEGTFLMAQVIYAEQYAKLVFDQALHDELLQGVIAANPIAPNLTLINTLAQERAAELLAESDDYF